MVEVLPRAVEVGECHGAVVVELQVAQHFTDVGFELALFRVAHRHRLRVGAPFPRQCGGQVDDVADVFGDGVRGERGVEPTTGMADEDVAGLQGSDDRIPRVRVGESVFVFVFEGGQRARARLACA